ncbi:protein of unknown function DUF817 [Deinococcus proteolyticus MRP]|uniref:DUF817 domain-containing protein n=1 Tax=Deinococcus proteolyticus (strain ATCC 35074 / DSM 20540 / JCM 6276 / NBRC 101906 / NCIMB 13154 / VKM Ac-1939 / CCM 2703 / MRP) TaxID=693977 RepID=F0RIX8_DEIPM|nr:DUF817 domain-containing protein [Deinococcus proteolyticus]ADY25237.1 protein of unknown function DUF817 [Deinococcus proteolyticus MRP]
MTRGSRCHGAGALLLEFVRIQALCCLFAVLVVGLLALSDRLPPGFPLARADAMLLGVLLVQAGLLLTRFETAREAAALGLFHLLGFTLEVFKVRHGSWSYDAAGLSVVGGVPLYAGFMYASVGSYMAQAWRRLDLALHGAPPLWAQVALAGAAYLNFFTHHYGPDLRWVISALLALAYARTRVEFTLLGRRLQMPLLASFGLIGLTVWAAENLGTLLGAWVYPHQRGGWQPVEWNKWLAWTLMVVVAFLIVSSLKRMEARLASGLPDTDT